jgi:hypothetical protein
MHIAVQRAGGVAVGLLGAWLGLALSTARAETVVVPNEYVQADASSNSAFPLGGLIGAQSYRHQQVYSASHFGDASGVVSSIRFRPDAVIGAAGSLTAEIEVRLSLTSLDPDELDGVFNDNPGASETVVLSRQVVMSATEDEPGPGNTRAFDLVLDVDDVFFYDPALGNLLLDIRNFAPDTAEQPPTLDTADVVGDAVSRVISLDVLDAQGNVATQGIVTAFELPEPEGASLASAAALALGALAARRAR